MLDSSKLPGFNQNFLRVTCQIRPGTVQHQPLHTSNSPSSTAKLYPPRQNCFTGIIYGFRRIFSDHWYHASITIRWVLTLNTRKFQSEHHRISSIYNCIFTFSLPAIFLGLRDIELTMLTRSIAYVNSALYWCILSGQIMWQLRRPINRIALPPLTLFKH